MEIARRISPSLWIMEEKYNAEGSRKIPIMRAYLAFGKIPMNTLYRATGPKNIRKLKNKVLMKKFFPLNKSKIESILMMRLLRVSFQNDWEVLINPE